jgi:hypothetical protein
MSGPQPVNVKKIPKGTYVPCSVLMVRKTIRRQKKLTGACPNWAILTIEGTPFCAAHAPTEARRLYP